MRIGMSVLVGVLLVCSSSLAKAQKQEGNKQFSPEKALQFFDKDKDQKISKQEASRAKRLTEHFEHFDTDKDGFLTLDELKRANSNSSKAYTYLENDGVYMYYETEAKDIYRKLLPEMFDLPDRFLVYTFISDFYKMEGDTEPYKEASIFLLGKYEGNEIWHCVYMPVTSEESMRIGVSRLGLPKTMGEIGFFRSESLISATVIDEHENTMTLTVDTTQYSPSEKEEEELKELSVIPKMNVLHGKAIHMGKKGKENDASSKSSVLDIAKARPDLLTVKGGRGEISFDISTGQKSSGTISPLELTPSRVIGAYYMHNKIPFSLTGKPF